MNFEMERIEMRMVDHDTAIETRQDGDGQPHRAIGYGVVYGRETEIFPGLIESVRAGAFEKALADNREIKAFFNHDPSMVLATTRSDPALKITDNKTGVKYDAPIPPTTYGSDLIVNLERGNVRGSSFSFIVSKQGDVWTEKKGVLYREIIEADLLELGPVTNPAYEQTSAALRSAESVYKEAREALITAVERARIVSANELELKKKMISVLEKY